MTIANLLGCLLNRYKEIDVKDLPSQGYFYNEDFRVSIKKADIGDIIEYEHNYQEDNISIIINKVKDVVRKNTKLNSNYTFRDVKSIDIVFLFCEIVKYTKGYNIKVHYIDEETGDRSYIKFNKENFNYFTLTDDILSNYNKKERLFEFFGYKYTLPSIGIEDCITNFLMSKSNVNNSNYGKYFYGFTYFLGHKNKLTFDEIDNLINIFNYEIEEEELKKIKKILKMFEPMQVYSLSKGDKVININSKIDMAKVWK